MNIKDLKGTVEANPTKAHDGSTSWNITINGQDLSEYLFYQNPNYETWKCGENEYDVAIHETWYYRGGPDMCVED